MPRGEIDKAGEIVDWAMGRINMGDSPATRLIEFNNICASLEKSTSPNGPYRIALRALRGAEKEITGYPEPQWTTVGSNGGFEESFS